MDYEKKHNDLVARLQNLANDPNWEDERFCCVINSHFHELKESENEGIRKDITEYFKYEIEELSNKGEDYEAEIEELSKYIAWVEKQKNVYTKQQLLDMGFAFTTNGDIVTPKESNEHLKEYLEYKKKQWEKENHIEQKPAIQPKFTFDDVLALQCCMETVKKVQEDKTLYEQLQSLHDRVHDAYYLEKQGEPNPQGKSALEAIKEEKVDNANKVEPKDYNSIDPHFAKPIDKVEPKFNIGQWIVWQDKCYKVNCNGCGYELIDQNGLSTSLEYGTIDKNAHLWDVTSDAKDGDVLFCKGDIKNSNGIKYERICLFNNLDNAFFTLTKYSNGVEDYCINVHIDYPDNIIPATKEQKEILFTVMKEAGYKWDAEKKESKNIVIPIFNIGDTIAKKHNSDIHDFGSFTITDITGGKYWYNDRIICDITKQDEWEIYEPVRQNSAEWSEEDEKNFARVDYACLKVYGGDSYSSDWLRKFLGIHKKWKPSDEQMNAVKDAIDYLGGNTKIVRKYLMSLYKDLKKL